MSIPNINEIRKAILDLIMLQHRSGGDFRLRITKGDFELFHIPGGLFVTILNTLKKDGYIAKFINISDPEDDQLCIGSNLVICDLELSQNFSELYHGIITNNKDYPNNKTKINISKDKGIYINDNLKYAIRRGSKREMLLMSLRGAKTSLKISDMKINNPIKEIREINNNFKTNLEIDNDLIVHIDTGGYRLNYNDLEINFID